MRKLVWVLLVVGAASQAAGCFFSSGDDGGGGDPQITATFDVYSGGPGDVICQQNHPNRGTDFVRVNARLTGTQGAGFSDVYDCNVVAARTPPLTTGPGDYDIWVDYGSDRGSTNVADWVITDTTQVVTVFVRAGEDLQVAADLRLDNGFLEATWTVDGGPCDATTPSVSILSTLVGTSTAVEDLYLCNDGNGLVPVITSPAPIGDYTIHFAALNDADQQIGEGTNVSDSIFDGNEYVDLGDINISTL